MTKCQQNHVILFVPSNLTQKDVGSESDMRKSIRYIFPYTGWAGFYITFFDEPIPFSCQKHFLKRIFKVIARLARLLKTNKHCFECYILIPNLKYSTLNSSSQVAT